MRFVGKRIQNLRTPDISLPRRIFLLDQSFAFEPGKMITQRQNSTAGRARNCFDGDSALLAEGFQNGLSNLGHLGNDYTIGRGACQLVEKNL